MSDRPDIPEADDPLLAAELALRLLEGEEAQAAARLRVTDAAFDAEVSAWEARFAELALDIDEVMPPAAAKAGLDARLFGHPEKEQSRGSFWPGFGVASFVSALALAAVLVFDPFAPPAPRQFGPANVAVAELVAEDASFQLTAVLDHDTGTMYLTQSQGGAAPGRSLQMWGLPADGDPVSIGVLPASGPAEFQAPRVLVPELPGLIVAISDEPEGGSPTGQPTGAVLAVGELIEF